jgi:hypothetical protein
MGQSISMKHNKSSKSNAFVVHLITRTAYLHVQCIIIHYLFEPIYAITLIIEEFIYLWIYKRFLILVVIFRSKKKMLCHRIQCLSYTNKISRTHDRHVCFFHGKIC